MTVDLHFARHAWMHDDAEELGAALAGARRALEEAPGAMHDAGSDARAAADRLALILRGLASIEETEGARLTGTLLTLRGEAQAAARDTRGEEGRSHAHDEAHEAATGAARRGAPQGARR